MRCNANARLVLRREGKVGLAHDLDRGLAVLGKFEAVYSGCFLSSSPSSLPSAGMSFGKGDREWWEEGKAYVCSCLVAQVACKMVSAVDSTLIDQDFVVFTIQQDSGLIIRRERHWDGVCRRR